MTSPSSHPSPATGAAAARTTPNRPVKPQAELNHATLLLMSVACGLCAGANYFNQPLLSSIGHSLGISQGAASVLVTCAQVSYALGLLFLVPLGDMLERRRLVLVLMLLAATGLLLSGAAQWLPAAFAVLIVGTLMTGLFSVAAQVLVPMASALVAPERSGRAVGLVMSGLLTGLLLSRTVAGVLSGLGGWNTVYWVGGVAMVLLAWLLARKLPVSRNGGPQLGYGAILRTMVGLFGSVPRLRSRTLLGALAFASVSVLFSTMALMLAGPEHRLSDTAIGLIGLAGVAGALMANVAGRMADQGKERLVTLGASCILVLGWLPLWLGEQSLLLFVLGMLLVDLALQGVHISNQNVVYRLAPQARSRINACYMTGYFIGASSGSAVGAMAWSHGGWTGACIAGVALAGLNLLALMYDGKLAARGAHAAAVG